MENVERITGKFETPENITTHEFMCGQKECAVLVHPDLSDVQTVRAIIYALKHCDKKINALDDFSENAVLEYDINLSSDADDCTNKLLNGDVILCLVVYHARNNGAAYRNGHARSARRVHRRFKDKSFAVGAAAQNARSRHRTVGDRA